MHHDTVRRATASAVQRTAAGLRPGMMSAGMCGDPELQKCGPSQSRRPPGPARQRPLPPPPRRAASRCAHGACRQVARAHESTDCSRKVHDRVTRGTRPGAQRACGNQAEAFADAMARLSGAHDLHPPCQIRRPQLDGTFVAQEMECCKSQGRYSHRRCVASQHLKASSPSLREMELTMALPWQHLRPASTM